MVQAAEAEAEAGAGAGEAAAVAGVVVAEEARNDRDRVPPRVSGLD
jgi:hypothetical protein